MITIERKYELGIEAKDTITGFKGIITGFVQYITGCDQYLITPPVDKDGKIVESHWYDDNRVVKVGRKKALDLGIKKEDKKGACEAAPIK